MLQARSGGVLSRAVARFSLGAVDKEKRRRVTCDESLWDNRNANKHCPPATRAKNFEGDIRGQAEHDSFNDSEFQTNIMPGNVKLGHSNEPDPDPMPFLAVSMEMKRADMLKAYDPKKSYWVPDENGGFVEALLQSDDGKKAVCMIGHEVDTLEMTPKSFKYSSNFLTATEKDLQERANCPSQSSKV